MAGGWNKGKAQGNRNDQGSRSGEGNWGNKGSHWASKDFEL